MRARELSSYQADVCSDGEHIWGQSRAWTARGVVRRIGRRREGRPGPFEMEGGKVALHIRIRLNFTLSRVFTQ